MEYEKLILDAVRSSEKTGYEILLHLRTIHSSLFADAEAELYVFLHKMEKQHKLRSRIQLCASGVTRKVYRIPGKAYSAAGYAVKTNPPQKMATAGVPDSGKTMEKLLFQRWCTQAISEIKISPERENISQELCDHMEDACRKLTDAGIDQKTAQDQIVAAMGSPQTVAAQLAEIHRPFWGYVELILRKTLIVLAIICTWSLGFYILENFFFDPAFQKFDQNAGLTLSGENSCILHLEPDIDASSDGYTISVENAAIWARNYQHLGMEKQQFYCNVQIHVTNPIPWADVPDFSQWYWAEDSLGNYYYAAAEDSSGNEPSIQSTDYRINLFSTVQELWISPLSSPDIDWIVLHYNRSGRDIALRINFKGGIQP